MMRILLYKDKSNKESTNTILDEYCNGLLSLFDSIQNPDEVLILRPRYSHFDWIFYWRGEIFPWEKIHDLNLNQAEIYLAGEFSKDERMSAQTLFKKIADWSLPNG